MTTLALILVALSASNVPKPIVAEQRLGRAVCRLELDPGPVTLSGSLNLTLSIEGPAPVEVEVPQPLTASTDWRTRAAPPRTVDLPDGRQRWEQTFRLEPFQVDDVALPLKPIRYRTGNEVRDWELVWPSQKVRVTSSVKNVDLGSARSVTDIEPLPPVESSPTWGWYAAVVVILLIAICGFAGFLRRRHARSQAALPPRTRALAELEQINGTDASRLADVLRRFLDEQFFLTATRQTTAEFHATLRQANVLSEPLIAAVLEVLKHGDLMKFASVRPGAQAGETLRRLAREVIAESGEARQGEPVR